MIVAVWADAGTAVFGPGAAEFSEPAGASAVVPFWRMELVLPQPVRVLVADRLGLVLTAPYWQVRNFGQDVLHTRDRNAWLSRRVLELELQAAASQRHVRDLERVAGAALDRVGDELVLVLAGDHLARGLDDHDRDLVRVGGLPQLDQVALQGSYGNTLRADGTHLWTFDSWINGYWNVDESKMSKSIGNVVDPLQLKNIYGLDAFRFFLIRDMNFGLDSNFSELALVQRINSDLANDIGNLFSRVMNMLHRYRGGVVPKPFADAAMPSQRLPQATFA